ncbi:helix-turn-helix transcriptional regulator [Agromyces arachidis]|uniref:helix-turn-helix transcriptional regulator n=1 Tax=Agromyces arachidis TaxID=766966 RepID=UPI004056B736
MRSVDARVADWVAVVAELIAQGRLDGTGLDATLHGHLMTAFDSGVVIVCARDASGLVVADGTARGEPEFAGRPLDEALELLRPSMQTPLLDAHPVAAWYAATGSADPVSLTELPSEFRRGAAALEVLDVLRRIDLVEELCIPVESSRRRQRMLVIGRPAADAYSDDDLELARRLQPLLRALDRHARSRRARETEALLHGSLSARELAILAGVARGLTSSAIGAKLGISPRTVEKHLEHAYRKLGVRDKVSAVRVAGEAHLLG